MCFGYSKQLSNWDGSFEYPQDILWLRNKENTFHYALLSVQWCTDNHNAIMYYKLHWQNCHKHFKLITFQLLIKILKHLFNCVTVSSNNLSHTLYVLKFLTLVVCQKGLDKQWRPRLHYFWASSEAVWWGFSLFVIQTSILRISDLVTYTLFEIRKRKVFEILEHLP